MIDLGTEVSASADPLSTSKKPKTVTVKTYPSLFLKDIPELDDLPDGEFYFLAKGQVVRHTEENPVSGTAQDDGEGEGGDYGKGCSCEISVISMKPVADVAKGVVNPKAPEAGLDEALTQIEQDKEDNADQGADDGTEE